MIHTDDEHKSPISRFLMSVWALWTNIFLMVGLMIAALFNLKHPISPVVLVGGSIFVLALGTQVIAYYRRRGQEQRRPLS